jgi:protein-S-isoprenylcysteine O-methyltransferase Ste14
MKNRLSEPVGLVINGLSIALLFYLAITLDVPEVPLLLRYLAWLLFAMGLILIVLSVMTLASSRDAGLIDRGLYGVIRHPMYLGAILLFLSWIFFIPHWIVLLVSLVNSAIVYWFILQGERKNIAKFGASYRRYMETVPRVDIVAGLLRILRGK